MNTLTTSNPETANGFSKGIFIENGRDIWITLKDQKSD
jgi:hypothetical protein